MLKKISVLLFSILASASTSVMAGTDVTVNIDGKNITITDIDHSIFSSERKFSTVTDASAVFISPDGVNIQRIVRERFELAGVHTVDKVEDSTISVLFLTTGSISMPNVDKAAEHSALLNQQQVTDNISPIAGSIVAGGPIGGIAYLAGFLFESNVKLIGSVQTKDGHATNTPMFNYKLEKGKEASDDAVFKTLVDQWINLYIVFPAPVAPSETVKDATAEAAS